MFDVEGSVLFMWRECLFLNLQAILPSAFQVLSPASGLLCNSGVLGCLTEEPSPINLGLRALQPELSEKSRRCGEALRYIGLGYLAQHARY